MLRGSKNFLNRFFFDVNLLGFQYGARGINQKKRRTSYIFARKLLMLPLDRETFAILSERGGLGFDSHVLL